MTKEELLEKAKRDYPIGTQIITVGYKANHTIKGDFTWNENHQTIYDDSMTVYAHKQQEWAEIVSKPEPKTPQFEIGKWYNAAYSTSTGNSYNIMFKVKSFDSKHIQFEDEHYINNNRVYERATSLHLEGLKNLKTNLVALSVVDPYLPEGHVDKIRPNSGYINGLDPVDKQIWFIKYHDRKGDYFRYNHVMSPEKGTYKELNDYSYNFKIVKDLDKDEIEWLEACIKANKFIPKEEALRTELTQFPFNGRCEPVNLDLVAFLDARPSTRRVGSVPLSSAKGIAWNESCHWYYTVESGKKEYKLEELEKFLPKLEAMKKEKYVPKVGDFVCWDGSGGKYHEIWKIEGGKFWIYYTPGKKEEFHNYGIETALSQGLHKREEKQSFFNETPKTEEKWCILITHENRSVLQEFYKTHMEAYPKCQPDWEIGGAGGNSYFHYPSYDGRTHSAFKNSLKDYKEITFDEFKRRYPTSIVIPEYVECIKQLGYCNIGGIFKSKMADGRFRWLYEDNNQNFRNSHPGASKGESWDALHESWSAMQQYFKPSTKEAYEAQNKPKVMKKDVKELKYPDVVHIESQEEWKQLHAHRPEIEAYDSRYKYYLIGAGGGYAKDRAPYEDTSIYKYVIYEFSDITFPSKEPELIEGQWYEFFANGVDNIVKYRKGASEINADKWAIKGRGNYSNGAWGGNITNLRYADMEEVYKYYPEERPKEKEINTYGLKVGDIVTNTILTAWSKSNNNRNEYGKWGNGGSYQGDKPIGKFKEINGITVFQRTECHDGLWFKAEGFKEFMDNFNKPKTAEISSLPKDWCLKGSTDEEARIFGEWYDKHAGNTIYKGTKAGQYISVLSDRNYGWGKHPSCTEITFEQFKKWVLKEQPKEQVMENLVGRYLKALRDNPQGGIVKIGEYGKINEDRGYGDYHVNFPSQPSYYVSRPVQLDKYELMPIGWTPETEKVMKYKIGDLVTILNVDNYKTDSSYNGGIPRELMIHGTATLHESAPNAKIVDIYKEYYIVNFINRDGSVMQLGFLEKDITLREKKKYKYHAVIPRTKEQWDFVKSKTGLFTDFYEGGAIDWTQKAHCDIAWYERNNGKMYSFEEWCTKFGHVFTPKKEEIKTGDWVICIGESKVVNGWTSSGWVKNAVFQVNRISGDDKKILWPEKGQLPGNCGVFMFDGHVRKALPHEIPTTSTGDDLLNEALRRYPVGTKYSSSGIYYVIKEGWKPYWWDGDKKKIAFANLQGLVYNNGIWSEIISYSAGGDPYGKKPAKVELISEEIDGMIEPSVKRVKAIKRELVEQEQTIYF